MMMMWRGLVLEGDGGVGESVGKMGCEEWDGRGRDM